MSDKNKSVYEIAQNHGYELIKHKFVTQDGYINTVFRLQKLSDTSQKISKPSDPDLLLSTSFDFSTHQKQTIGLSPRTNKPNPN